MTRGGGGGWPSSSCRTSTGYTGTSSPGALVFRPFPQPTPPTAGATRASGATTSEPVGEPRLGPTVTATRASTATASCTVGRARHGLVAAITKVNGKVTNPTAKGPLPRVTAAVMKADGVTAASEKKMENGRSPIPPRRLVGSSRRRHRKVCTRNYGSPTTAGSLTLRAAASPKVLG